MEKYLTVKETAIILRKTKQTVYNWLKEEKVFNENDYVKVVDGYLIKETAIDRILKR